LDIAQVYIQEFFQQSRQFSLQTWLNQEERWDSIRLQGVEYRIFSIPFHNNDESGVVQVYCSLNIINKFIGKYTQLLIATGLASTVVAALIGWLLAGRAMIPVNSLSNGRKNLLRCFTRMRTITVYKQLILC
jgi:hypothetical protein